MPETHLPKSAQLFAKSNRETGYGTCAGVRSRMQSVNCKVVYEKRVEWGKKTRKIFAQKIGGLEGKGSIPDAETAWANSKSEIRQIAEGPSK